jgi:ATP-dependent DNA helicase RecG
MPEDQRIEWKESWRDEYLRWICGFANANGGTLVIGRNNAGVDVGAPNAQKLLEDLPNKIRDVLGIVADVRLVQKSGLDLIEIEVGGYDSPISYKGEYHLRSGSTKQELKGEALTRFLLGKFGKAWDSVQVQGATAKELSSDAIAAFKKLAQQSQRVNSTDLRGNRNDLLARLKLSKAGGLSRAAILLFHSDPESYFTGAFVKIGYFRSESELLYQDEIHGDLFTQAQTTLDLLQTKYLRAEISYQGVAGLHRLESLPVPEPALREAVLNALIHRDYAVGAPIQIRVYRDRLKIWNPGELPEEWQVKNLYKSHASHPYNPTIANVFFRAGEIETWGRGIRRIIDSCRAAGTPRPVITYESRDIWIEFPFSTGNETAVTKNAGENAGENATGKTLTRRNKIKEILKIYPHMPMLELAKALRLDVSNIERHLKAMRDSGQVRRIGPAKGGRWEVL